MRNRLFKVYAILIGLLILLAAFFLHKRAFMGKSKDLLHSVDPDNAPTALQTPPSPAPAPAPAVDVASNGAQPPAVVTPDSSPSPSPSPSPSLGDPAKGGVGDAIKNIRGNREKHDAANEKSFNTPE